MPTAGIDFILPEPTAMFGRYFTWTPVTSSRVEMNASQQIDKQSQDSLTGADD
jgi:hypothetical protein